MQNNFHTKFIFITIYNTNVSKTLNMGRYIGHLRVELMATFLHFFKSSKVHHPPEYVIFYICHSLDYMQNTIAGLRYSTVPKK